MNDEERFELGKRVAKEFYGDALQQPFPADLDGDAPYRRSSPCSAKRSQVLD